MNQKFLILSRWNFVVGPFNLQPFGVLRLESFFLSTLIPAIYKQNLTLNVFKGNFLPFKSLQDGALYL